MIESLIVEHLRKKPKMTQAEMSEAIGKSKRTVQKAFASLQEKGLLLREGSKMNGVWVIEASVGEDV